MTTEKWKPRSLALGLGLSCWWPAVALGQDCSDKTKFLSEDWFLTKADCGADKLIAAGVEFLTDAGEDLAKAAVDQFLPGIASLLFNDDPYADDFAALESYVEVQATRIIDVMLDERSRINSGQLIEAMADVEDFVTGPVFLRVPQLDVIQNAQHTLDLLAIDLLWPQAREWDGLEFNLDFTSMAAPDVDRLHTVMEINGMRAEVIPLVASTEAYEVIVDDYDEPTAEELEDVRDISAEESRLDLFQMLRDQVDPYLIALSSKDLLRQRSDQRFTNLATANACGNFGYTWSKTLIGGDPFDQSNQHVQRYQFYYTDNGLQGLPPSCFGTYSGVGSYRTVQPNGTTTTGSTNHAAYVQMLQLGYGLNKFASYQTFLLQSYGAVRPALTRWYRMAVKAPPALAIDAQLGDALRADSFTASVLNALSGIVEEPLTSDDRRAAEDFVLENTSFTLYGFALAATAVDYLNAGGQIPLSQLRRYLYGEVGPDLFKEMAAAKMTSLTPM